MRNTKFYLSIFIIIPFLFVSCNDSSSAETDEYEFTDEEKEYSDDTYCAIVNYYNSNSGTRARYRLNVDVEDNQLVKICFSRGWLDEDHFVSSELDNDGFCIIEDDQGREFRIHILGPKCNFNDAIQAGRAFKADIEAITCPKCGSEKDEYDDQCDDCEDEEDHTCPRCGNYDAFMYSSDEYCSDCEDEVENTCSSCGGHEYNVNGGLCSNCEEKDGY